MIYGVNYTEIGNALKGLRRVGSREVWKQRWDIDTCLIDRAWYFYCRHNGIDVDSIPVTSPVERAAAMFEYREEKKHGYR